jgi:hypothetical protein
MTLDSPTIVLLSGLQNLLGFLPCKVLLLLLQRLLLDIGPNIAPRCYTPNRVAGFETDRLLVIVRAVHKSWLTSHA